MDVEQLAAAATGLGDGIGLELQWTSRIDADDPYERSIEQLALHVITARPGEHHSRYSTVELTRCDAEDLAHRELAYRVARDVAVASGLPLLRTPPADESRGPGESAWIRAQPAGPPYPYLMTWEAHWYTDDGDPTEASGRERVPATSGYDADITLSRELDKRFTARPLSTRIRGGGRDSGGRHGALWPTLLPSVDRVRDIALTEGCRASGIARGLIARAPSVSALDLMIGFEQAFHLWFDALHPLARWRRGELDDAGLDAAISVANTRERWDRPRRLREAHAAGESIARFVREELRQMRDGSVVEVIMALRDMFDIGVSDAKDFADRCRDARNDAELDALLRHAGLKANANA